MISCENYTACMLKLLLSDSAFQIIHSNWPHQPKPSKRLWLSSRIIQIHAWKDIMLGHVRLILPHIHIVKLRFITSLLRSSRLPKAGKDPVAFKCTIDRPEAALIDLVPAFQTFDHVHMSSGIIEVHVEWRRIRSADFTEAMFSAQQLDAALAAIWVKNPHGILPKVLPIESITLSMPYYLGKR